MADILIVEDEQLIAKLLKETLQSEGYNVVTVLNGEEAVKFALCETPHLIILDLMLPGIDGYEVIRRLQELKLRLAPPRDGHRCGRCAPRWLAALSSGLSGPGGARRQ